MKILLIEDDKALAKAITASLKEAGYMIDVTYTGQDGYLLARNKQYDLMIIDYFLPDTDGSRILADIRNGNSDTPVIIISGNAEVDNKIRMLEQGADDYIAKPFDLSELLARIKAIWRRPPQATSEKYAIGNLNIDFKRWLVTRNGRRIKMTNKELSLLRFFLDHKDTLLTRNTILEHVWDMNADPFSNTIETHIMKLRKSIGDKRHELIETIPGQGYIFRSPD